MLGQALPGSDGNWFSMVIGAIVTMVLGYLNWKQRRQDAIINQNQKDLNYHMEEIRSLRKSEENCRVELAAIKAKQDRDGSVVASGFVMANHAGIIMDADPNVCTLVGWKRRELIGQPIHMLIPGDLREQHEEKFREAVASPYEVRRYLIDAHILRRDGELVAVHIGLVGWGQNSETTFLAIIRPRVKL